MQNVTCTELIRTRCTRRTRKGANRSLKLPAIPLSAARSDLAAQRKAAGNSLNRLKKRQDLENPSATSRARRSRSSALHVRHAVCIRDYRYQESHMYKETNFELISTGEAASEGTSADDGFALRPSGAFACAAPIVEHLTSEGTAEVTRGDSEQERSTSGLESLPGGRSGSGTESGRGSRSPARST